MDRRSLLSGVAAICIASKNQLHASAGIGQRLALAAREQLGVTLGYDPRYVRVSYPNGDVPRSTGVCADVVIRAARDAFGMDLQKLVHEDMLRDFEAYPARKAWGTREPDANIDHRRVLNLETYWKRAAAEIWKSVGATPGDGFPKRLAVGDIVTWRLDTRLPHVGIVADARPQRATVIHNIGNGVEETQLSAFHTHRAAGQYRWPVDAQGS